jgi:site-specific DNA-methyltransferase (adenine-specific)
MEVNNIIHGDCLEKLKLLDSDSVDLVYLDPPFFTQVVQKLKNKDNSKEYSFDDKWENIEEFAEYIKLRLAECKRVIKSTGSIFLHCDKIASHYLRIALDQVFGYDNFQSEIIWSYRRWSNSKKGLLNSHQVIFFYSKTNDFKFNQVFEAYSPSTNIDQIFQDRQRDKNGKVTYKKDELGNTVFAQNKKGVPMSDVWDIPYLNPKAKERTGYPTQKPILLLERIINLVTDEGDLVLDPFCGSGTTLIAAKLLNRNYIGFDKSSDAVELTNSRLENPIKSNSNLLKNGRESYNNQDQDIIEILQQIDATPVQRNKGIDGFLNINGKTQPYPIRIQRSFETLSEAKQSIISATKNNNYLKRFLLVTTKNIEESLFVETDVSNLVCVETLIELSNYQKQFIKV